MNYILHYDIAGLVIIVLTIVCLALRKKRIKLVVTELLLLLICSAIYNVLDISTALLLKPNMSRFYNLCSFLLFLYFIVLIIYPYFITVFIQKMCELSYNKFLFMSPIIVIFALLCTNPYTHLFYNLILEPYTYVHGPLNHLPYLLYALSLIYVITISLIHKRLLGKIKVVTIIVTMFISIIVIALQIIFDGLLLTGFMISSVVLLLVLIYYFSDVSQDELTGLRNRVGFERKLSELFYFKPNPDYIFGRLEVYNIQDANERFGREYGDMILQSISEQLKKDYETSNRACCRLGGNSFGILLDKNDIQNTPLNIHLKDLIKNCNVQNDYVISIYIGFCPINQEYATDMSGIIERADFALSKVKGNFYKNIGYFDGEIRKEYERQKDFEKRLWKAIQKEEFKVYLQPIYDTETKKCVSAEALVRWIDQNNVIVPPNEFIPAFEANGFITELDMYVLDHVCHILSNWRSHNRPLIPISVNISRVDIDNPDLVDNIVKIVDKYQLPHDLIKVEITESAFNMNESLIIYTMQNLQNNGFIVMMDDFGSGYSNLNMFKNMPIDIVKIDMIFMKDIERSEKGVIIVTSVVNMAKLLGLKIVVEGVETDGQYNLIRKLGCDMIQGYYFAKPMPVDEFNSLM